MAYLSLTRRFLDAVDKLPNPQSQLCKVGDRWEATSSAELLRRAAGVAHALVELGVKTGDRVGLLAPNCPEWHAVDFAVLGLGAVDVPVYFNESHDRLTYIWNHSEAQVVVIIGEEQVANFLACREKLPHVKHVIVGRVSAETVPGAQRLETLMAGATDAQVADYRRRAAEIQPEQVATIIYTSGTTGQPKGVVLSHANLSSNDLDSASLTKNYTTADVGLSFLPLSHVYERMIDYGYIFRGMTVGYVEKPEQVQSALVEVRPTIMAAVPRVFEKIYAAILEKGRRATGFHKIVFDWAMRVTQQASPWRAYRRQVSLWVKLQWALANALVYPKIRAALGGRLRGCFSGSAPLRVDLLEFFWTVGVEIYQGYGLTETSPVVSTNWLGVNRVGTVGPVIRNVEVRIADDGEILVRGPCVMQGYYKDPAGTREVLSPDGWLRTGDIGTLSADNYLTITDRKKDLIKTAAGKFVAPQPIENQLKNSPLITNAVVIGDRRKYVVALIVPNFAALKAELPGMAAASPDQLVTNPRVREMIQAEVDRVNGPLAQYESVKRFALCGQDFTFENGQATYTMKVRRRVVEQKYADVIDSLYAEQ